MRLSSFFKIKSYFLYLFIILVIWTIIYSNICLSIFHLISTINDLFINEQLISVKTHYSYKDLARNDVNRLGLHVMKSSNVTIVGVCRNLGSNVNLILKQVEVLGMLFKYSNVIFVEGDSSDNTRQLLNKWANKSINNRTIISTPSLLEANESQGYFKGMPLPREGRITFARNIVLDQLKSTDYVISIDLDIIGWDLHGIVNSFSRKNWDVMCSLGVLFHGIYRDTYAYRNSNINTNHHGYGDDYMQYNITIDEKNYNRLDVKRSKQAVIDLMFNAMKSNSYKYNSNKSILTNQMADSNNFDLIRSDSCFGGLAIYKFESLRGCRYWYRHNEPPYIQDCEHVIFNECIRKKNNASIYTNPKMKLWYGHNPITYGNINKYINKYFKEITS